MKYTDVFARQIPILEEKKKVLEKEMNAFPPGSLECLKAGKKYRWYNYCNGKRVLLKKRTEIDLAASLLNKMQIQYEYEAVCSQICAMKAFNLHASGMNKFDNFFSKMEKPAYQDLLNALNRSCKKGRKLDSAEWEMMPFVQSQEHPENKLYRTPHGDLVRSKSEMMISLLLCQHHIPFHYEEELVLNGVTIYPDFTIRHPITERIVYWEHLGMIENNSYYQMASRKIQTYIDNGICPGDNLILTCEDSLHPFDVEKVNQMIRIFFGDA